MCCPIGCQVIASLIPPPGALGVPWVSSQDTVGCTPHIYKGNRDEDCPLLMQKVSRRFLASPSASHGWWYWEKPEAGTKTEWHSRTSALFGRRAAPLVCFPLEAVLGCFPLSLVHDAEAGVASHSRCCWFPLCVRLHGPPVPDSPVWLDE